VNENTIVLTILPNKIKSSNSGAIMKHHEIRKICLRLQTLFSLWLFV
jgi:hypothetical protein